MESLTDTVAWLVGIPSPTGEEAAIRDAIAARLDGFPQQAMGESLVVGSPGPGKVLLVGHIDTVPQQGDLGPRVDGDRIHGLGSTDMKGGVGVMVHLVEELGIERLAAVFYAGEEGPVSGNQLTAILDGVPGMGEVEAAVVLEPTSLAIEAGCNGAINARASFVGVAAHSARPWAGENAVTKSASFLADLHDRPPQDHQVAGLTFREVISVTRATGGVANNVIPGRFDLNINYRFAPDRTVEEAQAYLREVCGNADEFEIVDVAPAATPSAGHPFFQALASVSGGGVSAKQGWTDVAQLAARGIPAVNFGPGESELAHKPGESVRISDLTGAFRALAEVLASR